MAKYHINAKGEAGQCRAEAGGCPFGGEESHYPSKENAQKAFELSNAGQAMPPAAKKERPEPKSEHVVRKGARLMPSPEVEAAVNKYPSCYTERANNALRAATGSLYEWAAEKPRTVPEFEAEAQRIFTALDKKYWEDGMGDTEPRLYWHDHMDKIRADNGWAIDRW